MLAFRRASGSADFKTELQKSDLFDPRLLAVVIKVVDVSYGGDNGFNQAIQLSAGVCLRPRMQSACLVVLACAMHASWCAVWCACLCVGEQMRWRR